MPCSPCRAVPLFFIYLPSYCKAPSHIALYPACSHACVHALGHAAFFTHNAIARVHSTCFSLLSHFCAGLAHPLKSSHSPAKLTLRETATRRASYSSSDSAHGQSISLRHALFLPHCLVSSSCFFKCQSPRYTLDGTRVVYPCRPYKKATIICRHALVCWKSSTARLCWFLNSLRRRLGAKPQDW